MPSQNSYIYGIPHTSKDSFPPETPQKPAILAIYGRHGILCQNQHSSVKVQIQKLKTFGHTKRYCYQKGTNLIEILKSNIKFDSSLKFEFSQSSSIK